MSAGNVESGSSFETPSVSEMEALAQGGVFGALARISSQKARDGMALRRIAREPGPRAAARFLGDSLAGHDLEVAPPEILWRASGLRRPGIVAQVLWPRLSARFGLGLETPLAHAVIDRLLGFDREPAESRLQVSPVEWGIFTFLVIRSLEQLTGQPGPLGPWDLWIDRVGPDPFDTSGLPRIATIRWPVRLGTSTGSLRLWLPGPLVDQWVGTGPNVWPEPRQPDERQSTWTSSWRAVAGTAALPRGLRTLRPGGLLPLFRSSLRGTPQSPEGDVALSLALVDGSTQQWPAQPVPETGGARLTLTAPRRWEPPQPETSTMNPSTPAATPPDLAPPDVPVTLVVELGRVNIPLARLADLVPGDVIELQRHSREPVELTSGGRPVARGELVQIDNELGVRVTHVYL